MAELTPAQKSAVAAISQAEAQQDECASKMRADLRAYEDVMGLPSSFEIMAEKERVFWSARNALSDAAPELLAQLEWAESVLKRFIEGSAQLESLRAAIAKAKGTP